MGDRVKRLAILGSTGSIGRQTLEVVRCHRDELSVRGLAAGGNADALAEQVAEFRPGLVAMGRGEAARPRRLRGCQEVSLSEMASHPDVDLVVMAISGSAALAPTLAAIEAGKAVALASKEVLVMAGGIAMARARREGITLRPVDSEPSAIWQCLQGESGAISRIWLTASGGPFRHLSPAELERVTAAQALAHPTWCMGPKITIDSATLMNKGFEAIEIGWLFDTPLDDIEVVVHPQSVVHSMVELADGSVKAQLSPPDMRLPIQYALFYPERRPAPFARLDVAATGALTFEPPDGERFPCLRLALEAGRQGGTYPAVLSAADEVAVQLFLEGRIGFGDIARIVAEALERHDSTAHPALEDILAADAWAREQATRTVP